MTENGPLFEHNGSFFSLEWSGATSPKEDSYFELQDALMNSANYNDLSRNLPGDYSSMPVNVVAGFNNGDISYNLMASLYAMGTGN